MKSRIDNVLFSNSVNIGTLNQSGGIMRLWLFLLPVLVFSGCQMSKKTVSRTPNAELIGTFYFQLKKEVYGYPELDNVHFGAGREYTVGDPSNPTSVPLGTYEILSTKEIQTTGGCGEGGHPIDKYLLLRIGELDLWVKVDNFCSKP